MSRTFSGLALRVLSLNLLLALCAMPQLRGGTPQAKCRKPTQEKHRGTTTFTPAAKPAGTSSAAKGTKP